MSRFHDRQNRVEIGLLTIGGTAAATIWVEWAADIGERGGSTKGPQRLAAVHPARIHRVATSLAANVQGHFTRSKLWARYPSSENFRSPPEQPPSKVTPALLLALWRPVLCLHGGGAHRGAPLVCQGLAHGAPAPTAPSAEKLQF